jgi:hypothetical protein
MSVVDQAKPRSVVDEAKPISRNVVWTEFVLLRSSSS